TDIAFHFAGSGKREEGRGTRDARRGMRRGASLLPLPSSRFPLLALAVEQLPAKIIDRSHADYLDAAGPALWNSTLRHIGARHPHLGRFTAPALGLRYRAYLTAEPNFSEKDRGIRDRPVVHARRQCACHRKISRRLLHPHTPDDVEKHIELGER